MSHTIPTTEPTALICGDRWQWTKSLGDYSAADGWTLTYYLHGQDASDGSGLHISFSSTADGSDHAIDVAAATTAAYVPGTYYWRSFVSDGTSRYAVEAASVKVEPNPATITTTYDGRSDARQILDLLRATIKRAVSRPESSYSFSAAGQSFSYRSLDELRAAEADYAAIVATEEADALAARGLGTGRNVLVEFNNA